MPTLCRNIDPLDDARTFWHLLQLLRRLRPAIVHTHMAKAGAIGRQATITYNTLWARKRPAKIVHTYHGHVLEGYFSAPKTAVFLAAERRLARRTDALIAVSPRIRHDLLENYRIGQADRFQVVPLGFELDTLAAIDDAARQHAREELDIPANAKVVTWVGRLTAIKQPEIWVQAARLIAQRFPKAIFLMVGDGELRSHVESTANRLAIANHIRFLGWRGDLARIYGASDLLLLTSRNEGTPVALIEAMAAGLPSVSPDVGGIRDVVTDPGVGIVVTEGSPESLAAAACALLDTPDRCRRIGESARPSAISRFGFARLTSDITALYRDLLDHAAERS
jgi:glycosyltransferase involved in cell wall biosynthesis